MLTQEQITKYRSLPNPPQSLYNALIKQVYVKPGEGRNFNGESGYMALGVYYYYLRVVLGYSVSECIDEMGLTQVSVAIVERYLDHSVKNTDGRFVLKIKLVRNYILIEQLKMSV